MEPDPQSFGTKPEAYFCLYLIFRPRPRPNYTFSLLFPKFDVLLNSFINWETIQLSLNGNGNHMFIIFRHESCSKQWLKTRQKGDWEWLNRNTKTTCYFAYSNELLISFSKCANWFFNDCLVLFKWLLEYILKLSVKNLKCSFLIKRYKSRGIVLIKM